MNVELVVSTRDCLQEVGNNKVTVSRNARIKILLLQEKGDDGNLIEASYSHVLIEILLQTETRK